MVHQYTFPKYYGGQDDGKEHPNGFEIHQEQPDAADKPKQTGACARCKSLKVRCEFKGDNDTCKRCTSASQECVITGRKPRRTPPKREFLLKQIRGQAEQIQELMAQLDDMKRLAATGSFSSSSTGATTRSENSVESDEEEYGFDVEDDTEGDGDGYATAEEGGRSRRSQSPSPELKKNHQKGILPLAASPFGLMAQMQIARGESAEPEPQDAVGIANANFFGPSPAIDPIYLNPSMSNNLPVAATMAHQSTHPLPKRHRGQDGSEEHPNGSEVHQEQPDAARKPKRLKVRREFMDDVDTCKRCTSANQECVVSGQKLHRAPPKREFLPKQIHEQAGIQIQEFLNILDATDRRDATGLVRSPLTDLLLQDLTKYITKVEDHPVARGGFGEIWRCIYSTDQGPTKVAVKSLLVYASDQLSEEIEKKKTKRIRREFQTCARLKHANILAVYGYTYGFGRFMAIVSPWAENGNLTTYMEREDATLTLVRRFEILRDIASGLQYLHGNNVIHGDLNSPNILIHSDGTACLADFGLSLLYSEVVSVSQASWTSTFHGNFRWLAPELLGRPEDDLPVRPSKLSDIYSFGGVMLHVLTSKIPYHYRSEAVVIRCIFTGEKPFRSCYPAISDKYWHFIEQCWSVAIQDRPSAERVLEVIRAEHHELDSSSSSGAYTYPHGENFMPQDQTANMFHGPIPMTLDADLLASAQIMADPLWQDNLVPGFQWLGQMQSYSTNDYSMYEQFSSVT